MIAAAAITPTSAPGAPDRGEAVGHERLEIGGVEERQRDDDEHVSASILTTTSTALRVALSRVPAISSPATTAMIEDRRQIDDPAELGPVGAAANRPCCSNGAA